MHAAQHWLPWLPWLPTALYLAGALACCCATPPAVWRALALVTRTVLGAAAVAGAVVLAGQPDAARPPADKAAALVMVLVAFLGWTIGGYSRRYLQGEPGQQRFTASFLATLAGVNAVLASTNLWVLISAWAASSVALHQLLTFYPQRPAAVVVAHKKFLASRLAEACLVAAAVLLGLEWGTADLALLAAKASAAALPPRAEAAAVLVAIAVLLKCAQLPLHGWLIQVMEAPTPVSALLHAGVVNLGGFVLLRLAPLVGASSTAQALLVVVGGLTAAIAGLVMMTRVTIKVRLAWSTCSQMGLMVMECGLGLHDLALLHLLAHALYKAHAFLTAGGDVQAARERTLLPMQQRPPALRGLIASALALAVAALATIASTSAWHGGLGVPTISWLHALFLSCGLATLMGPSLARGRFDRRAALAMLGAIQLYLCWHWLLTGPMGVASAPAAPILATWSALLLLALYFAQSWLPALRGSRLGARLYDWSYAGLYLDEHFTRLTFRIWPPKASPTPTTSVAVTTAIRSQA